MRKFNFGNIQKGLDNVKAAAEPMQNRGHTENVPSDYIFPAKENVFNKNDTEEAIRELADDIEAKGLIHPLAVNKISSERYEIISGERRFRAITNYLHWKSIPCMVFDNLPEDVAALKLYTANLAVREYTTAEKFGFYLKVKDLITRMKDSGEFKGSMQKGIADALSITERQVRKYVQLEGLSEELQQEVINGRMSINQALDSNKEKQAEKENSSDPMLSQLLGSLSDEQKELLLSGQVDLGALISAKAVSEVQVPVESLPETPEQVTVFAPAPVEVFPTVQDITVPDEPETPEQITVSSPAPVEVVPDVQEITEPDEPERPEPVAISAPAPVEDLPDVQEVTEPDEPETSEPITEPELTEDGVFVYNGVKYKAERVFLNPRETNYLFKVYAQKLD